MVEQRGWTKMWKNTNPKDTILISSDVSRKVGTRLANNYRLGRYLTGNGDIPGTHLLFIGTIVSVMSSQSQHNVV